MNIYRYTNNDRVQCAKGRMDCRSGWCVCVRQRPHSHWCAAGLVRRTAVRLSDQHLTASHGCVKLCDRETAGAASSSIHPSPSTLSLLALSSLFVTCMNEPQAQLSRRSSDSLQIADGARASRCPVEHFEFGWPLPARTFCACRGDRAERTANWVGHNDSSFLLRKSGSGRDQGAREERAPPARYQLSALPCGASLLSPARRLEASLLSSLHSSL